MTTTTWSSLLLLAERAQVAPGCARWRPAACSARLRLGQVGELRDGRPGAEDGAGPDVRRPTRPGRAGSRAISSASKTLERWCRSRTAWRKLAAADVVAADDELCGRVEVEAVEEGQGGDEEVGVGRGRAAQGGQAEGRGGADAAEGADQPQTDAT